MTKKRAATAEFTYTKLLKRIAPGAIAIAACLLLLSLAGLTNQHEWAVGWLRRRYEGADPFPFLFMALERGFVLIAMSSLMLSPTERENEETDSPKKPKRFQTFVSGFPSFAAVNSPWIYAVLLAVLALLKLLGAGVGTSSAASVCAGAAFVYQKISKKKGVFRWYRTLQGAVGSVYIGYAFAHGGASSWLTGLWMSAVLYAAPLLMMGILFILALSAYKTYGAFNMALKYWKWIAAAAGATALWLWVGGSLEWTLEWAVGWLAGRYDGLAPWSFCWRIALESTAIVMVLFLLIAPFESSMVTVKRVPGSKEAGDSDDTAHGILARLKKKIFFFKLIGYKFDSNAVFVVPIDETLLFQALIIIPLNALGADIGTQTVVSAALFFLAHCPSSPVGNILAAAPGGVYLGYAFAHWLPFSYWNAFWVTALAHALFNLLSDFWAVPAGVVVGLIKARRERRKMRKENAETDET